MNRVSPADRDGCTDLAAVNLGSQIQFGSSLQVDVHCNGR